MPAVLPYKAPVGYLDATAGQPLDPKAREILLAAFDQAWANPEGLTPPSRQSRALLDGALDQIATLLGVRRDQISLVSDAQSALLSRVRGRLIHSTIERSEVLTAALSQTSLSIGVNSLGRIDLEQLKAELKAGDCLFLQPVNGEVGTLQPIDQIAELVRQRGATLLCDFTHAIGLIDIPSGVTVGANASTWGGPRGIGILVSDHQEHSPNVSVALALAASAALEGWFQGHEENQRLHGLIDQLRKSFASIADVDLVGDPVDRAPHILTASFLYVDGQRLMDELARQGIYVGSGSACTSSRIEPSHVLAAMGALTHGNLRVVLPRGVDENDLNKLASLLPGIVEQVRNDLR